MTAAFPRKRFYSRARLDSREGGFAVLLDDKPVLTPGRAVLLAPSPALGAALVQEWESAPERLDPDLMALTRLSMTAFDADAERIAAWTAEVLKYAGGDLLCYRAHEPSALVRRQEETWTPFLKWAGAALGARLAVTHGVGAVPQPKEALDAVAARLAALDAWRLLGVRRATEITGSAMLALALESGAFPEADILAAARLDETFQAERWGWDPEAAAREARIKRDFADAARFLSLLGNHSAA